MPPSWLNRLLPCAWIFHNQQKLPKTIKAAGTLAAVSDQEGACGGPKTVDGSVSMMVTLMAENSELSSDYEQMLALLEVGCLSD